MSVSLSDIFYLYSVAFGSFFLAAIFFTALEKCHNLQCTCQAPWWRNSSIKRDIIYVILNPAFKVCLRFLPVALIFVLLMIFFQPMQIYMYLINGSGPLGRFSAFAQCVAFILISDFLFYWSHRIFHGKYLWPLHAVHHGPHDVDWTTAYRFHPLNLAFGPWLVTSLMILLGVSPTNILLVAPLEAIMAYFVHSNLNITLGPFKYFVATPVFHRWHHTYAAEGGASNYGAIFSIWDVLFGTFYFPESRLPSIYGIEDDVIEENFLVQLIYPFNKWLLAIRCTWQR